MEELAMNKAASPIFSRRRFFVVEFSVSLKL
jgi:hypothetical protein